MSNPKATPDESLVRAYLSSKYFFFLRGEEIDFFPEPTTDFLQFLAEEAAKTWAYIGAYNPGHARPSAQENAAAHRELQSTLEIHKLRYFEGRGVGEDGFSEPGYLVLNLTEERAKALAVRFGQYAILFGAEEKGRLLWLAGNLPADRDL